MVARDLITIRLDPAARTRLRQVARRSGLTASASVRLAIDAWLAAHDATAEARPYHDLADLIGCVELPLGRAATARRMRKPARRGGVR